MPVAQLSTLGHLVTSCRWFNFATALASRNFRGIFRFPLPAFLFASAFGLPATGDIIPSMQGNGRTVLADRAKQLETLTKQRYFTEKCNNVAEATTEEIRGNQSGHRKPTRRSADFNPPSRLALQGRHVWSRCAHSVHAMLNLHKAHIASCAAISASGRTGGALTMTCPVGTVPLGLDGMKWLCIMSSGRLPVSTRFFRPHTAPQKRSRPANGRNCNAVASR